MLNRIKYWWAYARYMWSFVFDKEEDELPRPSEPGRASGTSPQPATQKDKKNGSPNVWLYQAITWPFWLLLAVTTAGWLLPVFNVGWFPKLGIHFDGWTLYYGFLLSLPTAAYIIASFRKVQTYERGGVMVFEKPAIEVGPSWLFVPLGFAELHAYPISRLQKQFPGEPEMIFKGDDNEPLPHPDMVREIRATTAAPKPRRKDSADEEFEEDLLNVRKTIAITFFAIYKMKEGNFFDFYSKIPGESWEEKRPNIEKMIRDSAETDIVEAVAQQTLGELLTNINSINESLKEHVQANLAQFGIEIIEIKMQNPDISKSLAEALDRIPIANANAKATVTDAKANATKIRTEGQAKADAVKAEIEAKGLGQRAAANAMGMQPAEYRAGEVITETLKDNSKFIFGNPFEAFTVRR